MSEQVEELPSSPLGTKEYWDSTYDTELSNYKSDGNIGDIWFGEESIERVLNWMLESDMVNLQSSIIDVGCGNGAFLICLAAEGFTNLLGIDYSQNAIELARAIALEKKLDIKYEPVDLLSEGGKNLIANLYDICHDKGTYDAISLCPEEPQNKRLSYIKAIHSITKENGLFIITSCNWTSEELIGHFKGYFSEVHTIPTPTFMFGGRVGSQISCIVFTKVSRCCQQLVTRLQYARLYRGECFMKADETLQCNPDSANYTGPSSIPWSNGFVATGDVFRRHL